MVQLLSSQRRNAPSRPALASEAASSRWSSFDIRSNCLAIGRWRVHYVAAGVGPPVILIHGFGASYRWWRYSLPILATRYRVYALDLPGFGRSSRHGRFAISDTIEMIDSWMAAMNIDQAHVIGHSLGGQVALSLTLRYPRRVDRLILANATGLSLVRPLWQLAWQGVQSELGHRHRTSAYSVAAALHSGPRVLWSASQAIVKEDLRQQLGAVHAPTLIVWGDKDRLVPLENGFAMARGIPGAQLHVLSGGGHKAMIEQPAAFNTLAMHFLAESPLT